MLGPEKPTTGSRELKSRTCPWVLGTAPEDPNWDTSGTRPHRTGSRCPVQGEGPLRSKEVLPAAHRESTSSGKGRQQHEV